MAAKTTIKVLSTTSTACCAPLSAPDLSDADAVFLAQGFAALADPVRVRLLNLVANAPADGVCVCDLVESVERSQPTVSHHLKILRDAGLVDSERRGTWMYYRPDRVAIAALRASIM